MTHEQRIKTTTELLSAFSIPLSKNEIEELIQKIETEEREAEQTRQNSVEGVISEELMKERMSRDKVSCEKILQQLTEEFSQLSVQISEEEIRDLSQRVEEEFKKMAGKPSKIYKFERIPVPNLKLTRIGNERTMAEKMPSEEARNSFDIELQTISYQNLEIHMISERSFRLVHLFFVLPYTPEEMEKIKVEAEKAAEEMFLSEETKKEFMTQFMRNME